MVRRSSLAGRKRAGGRRHNKVHDINQPVSSSSSSLSSSKNKNSSNCKTSSTKTATSNGNGKKKGKGKSGTKKKHPFRRHSDDDALRQMIAGPENKREIIEMQADGNCLFRSISHQLHRDYGKRHDIIRHEICNFLGENEEELSMFLLLDDDEEDVREFDNYVSEMRQDGTWGGDVEIVCAARLYRRNMTIFSSAGAYNIGCGGFGDDAFVAVSGPDLLLSYHENSHYNSVFDVELHSNQENDDSNATIGSGTVHANASRQRKTKSTVKIKPNGQKSSSRKRRNSHQQSTDKKNDGDNNYIGSDDDEIEGAMKQALKRGVSDQNKDTSSNSTKSPLTSHPAAATLKRNDKCLCGSGLRYKKCCLTVEKNRIRLQKHKEKYGLVDAMNTLGKGAAHNEDWNGSRERQMEDGFNILTI